MAIINGTSKNDELSGGDGNDSITGLAGNDKLAGGSGNDTLDGGDGNDELAGGSGNDVLVAGAGNDKVDGGEGDDRLDGGDGNDDITAGSGNDSLTGAGGNDKIDGGSGNDFIDSGDGNDDITAGSGNDSIAGGAGNDKLDAGDGNDSIVGGDGNDNIVGGAGNDTLGGGAGTDKIEGGDGNDMFVVTAADLLNGNNDNYVGGAGTDTLRFDLTAAEWARADIKAAVTNLQGQLASSGIEAGQTYVDGVLQGGGGGDTTPPAAPTVALASDTGSSATDRITSNGALNVTPAEAGGTIQYSINGGTSWTSSFTAAEGANSVQVRQVDEAGNNGAATSFSFTLDTAAPNAPTVALTSDTGNSAADKITKVGTLNVTPAESGGTVQYSTNGGSTWTSSFAATEGANSVQVRQVDVAGNTSAATSFSFTLDTAAPTAPTVALTSDTGSSASDGITRTGTLAIGGTEAGAAVEYSTNGGTSWASSFAAVEGANSVQVRQTDAAGNTSATTSFSFTLDTAAPTAPTVALTSDTGSSSSDGITKTGTLAIGGTESGATVEYSTNGGTSWTSSFAAAEGANSVQVRQTDVAGNSSAATSFSFTLDTGAPTAPTVALTSDTGSSASDGITKTGTLAIGGTESGATVEYSTNGGTSWTSSFAAAEGANSVQVRQTDAAGNTSAATSFSFTLDTAAPTAPTVALTSDTGSSSSDGISKTGTLAIGGTESGATVEYSTNGGSTWTSSFAAAEGANNVQVRQTDVAGNASAATSFSFTLDTTSPSAPTVSLASDTGSSGSDGITKTGTLAIGGTEAGAVVEYSTNGGSSWSSSFTAAEGANNVQVRQTDAAGNTSATTSFSFTLDTAAPTAPTVALTSDTGSSSSDGITRTGTLAIGGTESGATVEYSTNGGSSWSNSFTAAEGANSVQVRQTDAAGNASAVTSFSFTLDTAAPTAPTVALTSDTGSSNSDGITKTGTLAIGATEAGAAVEYSTNGGSTWSNSFTAAEGANNVQVRQTDAAGNTSAATSFSFTLDTAAPSAPTVALTSDTGSSNSDGITRTGTLVIGGTESGATVEYSTNGGSSWSNSFTAAEGANSVQVRQTDAAGNTSAVTSFSFTLDTAAPTAPTVVLTSDTGSSSSDGITKTGTLAVGGTESGAVVEYSTNGGSSWSNSFTAAEGANNVQVRQTDTAGNTSAVTSFSFTLDTTNPSAPTVALTSDTGSSASDGITKSGTLAIGGTEAGATVEYSINGGSSWSSSFTAAEGANNVQVRQTDTAGNTSAATSFSFTLDTAVSAPTVALTSDTGSSNSDRITKVGTLAVGSESGATVEYSTNGGSSWSNSFTAAQGVNNVQVRQTDAAGNTSAATSFSFTLDSVKPSAPTVALSNDTGADSNDLITNDGALTVTDTVPGALIEYSTDGGTTWSTSFTAVEGANDPQVRQTDIAGNSSDGVGFAFTFDSIAPSAPTITSFADDSAPTGDGRTTDTTPTLTISAAAGSTVQVFNGATLLGTATETTTAGSFTFTTTALAVGGYSFTAKATDAAGNQSAASSAFSIEIGTAVVARTDVDVAALGNQGFRVFGADSGDQAGASVSSAGDINGDGYDDIIIGAWSADGISNSRANAGEAIIVFGKAGGLADIDVNSPAFQSSGQGFRIFGGNGLEQSGYSVAAAGDVNGDGFDDLIVGIRYSYGQYSGAYHAGEAVVLFGKSGGFDDVDLANGLSLSDGFRIFGTGDRHEIGHSVASAGDVNGDGYADLILGARYADGSNYAYRGDSGEAVILFGGPGPNDVDLQNLSSNQGFRIFGADDGDRAGYSVASAGDINGDGYDDLVIGVPYGDGYNNGSYSAGDAIVLFGKSGGFGDVDLQALSSSDGFRIYGADGGDQLGSSVASAGDINGDGFDDLIIGAKGGDGANDSRSDAGEAMIVFGKATGFSDIDLASTNLVSSGQGFRIFGGENFATSLGISVASAGDVNDDGYADLIIGTRDGESGTNGKYNTGETIIVYGKAGGFTDIDLATANLAASGQGFVVFGADSNDRSGVSVAAAGDVDGDGIDDIIIGASGGNGPSNNRGGAGEAIIIYGSDGTPRADTIPPAAPGVALNVDSGSSGTDRITNVGTLLVTPAEPGGSIQYSINGGTNWTSSFTAVEGSNNVQVRQVDAAGNNGAARSFSFTLDTIAPTTAPTVALTSDTGISATDKITNTGTLTVTGVNAGGIAQYSTNGGSTWSNSFTAVSGVNNVQVRQADVAGNSGPATSFTFTLDTTAPSAPVIQSFADDSAPTGDGRTLDNTLTLTISATAGSTVQVFSGATLLGTATETATAGSFTFTTAPLALSSYNFTARATDAAGNQSAASNILAIAVVSPDSPSDIAAATMTTTQGFRIVGADARDLVGTSVASAGDINGDGYDDLIIGARDADGTTNLKGNAGEAIIVFGKAGGFSNVNVASASFVSSGQGFRIFGADQLDGAGASVSSAGDINGDGYDDLIVGAYRGDGATGTKSDAGEAIIVFGKAGGFSDVDVASATFQSSGQGFRIFGADAGDRAGTSVASAGDINGDGYDDLIIGAGYSDGAANGTSDAGEAIIVFGKASGFADIDVASATFQSSGQGFRIFGADDLDNAGRSVASAGDVNGDGYDDLIVGAMRADGGATYAQNAGEAIIVFGKAGGFSDINVATMTPSQGFRIYGADALDIAGISVASAGDINGDGYDELIVGAYGGDGATNGRSGAGEAIIVFGKAGGFTDINVASATFQSSGQGFRIYGVDSGDQAGASVSSAGDINGDGYDDLIIGAPKSAGATNSQSTVGEAIVVFGKAGGFTDIDVASGAFMPTGQGFRIFGADRTDNAGLSVASAGDVNGDGYDDLIVGAIQQDGADGRPPRPGEAIVVFGGNFTNSVNRVGTNGSDALTGTSAAENFVAGQGNDTLTSGGGADAMDGGQGDDVFRLSDAGFRNISGGSGKDMIVADGAGISFDFTAIGQSKVDSIEAFDLTGSGNNTLRLNKLDVLALSEDTSGGFTRLTVHGDAGDVVDVLDSGWASVGTTTIGANAYTIYQNGQAQIIVDTDVTFG